MPSLRTVAALALLTAGVAFAPGRAAAQCGDYVRIGGASTAGHDQHDPGVPTPDKPCHGPGCSGHPATPVVPVTAPGAGGSPEWAARLTADLAPAASRLETLPLTSETGAVSRPGSIFHPPRAG
ncbi:MAG: hypothetical protein K2X82_29515 [Gemmataceae bacterium]|nr:hypothetical protein [Gemmataceae bacterium]